MKKAMFIAFLAVTLAACAPATQPMNQQGTAIAVVLTDHFMTQTALPTATPPPPTVTPTATAVVFLSTPPPTQPPVPILTPDAIQVKRWKEYQTELAKVLFVYNPSFPIWGYGPDAYTDALCEWDILKQRGQEVYVWAACAPAANSPLKGNSRVNRQNPAVIYLEPDGTIQQINIASEELSHLVAPHLVYDLHLFPVDMQVTLCLYYFVNTPQCGDLANRGYPQSRQSVLAAHLKYRESHPDEPPLVVLSAMPTATLTP